MNLIKTVRGFFYSGNKDFIPIFSQQAGFVCQTSAALVEMLKTRDESEWRRLEKEVKLCEIQGDALLTEFYEFLSGKIFTSVSRIDLQTLAMSMDDCLDVIKDASKSILIYKPRRIDAQLLELANMVKSEADVLMALLPKLSNIRKEYTSIALQCDRVKELEHAADDAYEDYIGYIFEADLDMKEMIKYKNIAEALENATDAGKRVSDNVRKILLKGIAEN
ncbi:MAG: DUF47 family protein [Bacteroidales bacterium]|jgi:uncharacterized protein Yka (UPF0111/DUF47 family)|nr:DUF47 family protein [Bacteroidales bacterium]